MVVISDIQDALGEATAASIGPPCTYAQCDAMEEAQVHAIMVGAVAAHGRHNVMLSNAGVVFLTGSVTDAPQRLLCLRVV